MSAKMKFGAISIDPVQYGSQGNAILGIRGSGKTYTATALAEKLFDAGIPFITFDPIGVWRYLRVPGNGHGYKVVVAGGEHGDLPLTVNGAAEIVRAAMNSGVSLIIDLFDINLSKADWKRIVTSCVRVLLHENSKHGLRHIFIEEAAEFAPQRVGPDQGAVYAEIEKLARMGGNARLGYTLINQRAEEVNKAVLELCDSLFLHRQKGRNSLTALSKWLDIGNVTGGKKIIESLSTLPTGVCWAWMAGSEIATEIKVPKKNSFHPDRTVMRDGKLATKKGVDVQSFVADMRGSLVEVEKEAAAKDPEKLKKKIAELEKQLRGKAPVVDGRAIAQTRRAAWMEGYNYRVEEEGMAVPAMLATLQAKVNSVFNNFKPARTKLRVMPPGDLNSKALETVEMEIKPHKPLKISELHGGYPQKKHNDGVSLLNTSHPTKPAHEKIIRALHFWKGVGFDAPTKFQVAAVAGYSATASTLGVYLAELAKVGLIKYPKQGCVAYNGVFDPRHEMDRRDAENALLEILSGPEKKVVDALPIDQPIAKEDLCEATGYSANASTMGVYLARLKGLDIISYPERGRIQITDWAAQVLSDNA